MPLKLQSHFNHVLFVPTSKLQRQEERWLIWPCVISVIMYVLTFERFLMPVWPSIRLSIPLSICLLCFCFRWSEYIFFLCFCFVRSFIWMSIFGQLFALFFLANMVSSPNTTNYPINNQARKQLHFVFSLGYTTFCSFQFSSSHLRSLLLDTSFTVSFHNVRHCRSLRPVKCCCCCRCCCYWYCFNCKDLPVVSFVFVLSFFLIFFL